MDKNTKIVLAIVRDANRQNVILPPNLLDILCNHLGVSNQDLDEVITLVQADLLENVAMTSEFESIKTLFHNL